MPKYITLGLPKGSLQEATLDLMKRAGFTFTPSNRSYHPLSNDDEVRPIMFRAQEIAKYTERGIMDAGLTGHDWILENGADVVGVADLVYSKATTSKARWVLAVPEASPFQTVNDLEGKRIATELVSVVRKYFAERGVNVEVEYSWGATEVKVPDIVDAIVDLTETGSSLSAHNLRVIDTVLETNTKLIANKQAWADPWKRQKIENVAILLRGALEAEGKVGLKLNVPDRHLKAVIAALPQEKKPTVSPLRDHEGKEIGWSAIEVILPESTVRTIIPALKRAGGQDIIEYPLNKVIY